MITECGIRNLKLYCREPIENIKGYRDAVESEGRYDCHHINELTFTRDELIKMNMYYNRPASELVIMTRAEHKTWHNKWNGHPMKGRTGEKSPMYGRTGEKSPMYGRTGEKSPMYGRTGEKNPMYGRTGEKSPMYGKTGEKSPMYGKGYLISGDKHPNWKGDKAGVSAQYKRARKLYKTGQMTEEEFQPFRDAVNEYNKQRKKRR